MPKVSIIVPVYNVEKTLLKCVDSILEQTYKDYEVILVNDGSTDKSGNICDELVNKYSNFKVIHKQNEGLGPTRDRGLDESCGEYIYHCDSDDWLEPDLICSCVKALEEHNADVVIFGYKLYVKKDDDFIYHSCVQLPAGVYEGAAVRKFYSEQYFNSFSVQLAWNRLYRKSFLVDNNIRFPSLRRCQDMAYSLILFGKLNKLVTLSGMYYDYVITPGVFKGRSFIEMIETYKYIFDCTRNSFLDWNLYDKEVQEKLQNKICEHIANYSSYAFMVKYPNDFTVNVKYLIEDETIQSLFSFYKGRASRFMFLFKWSLRLHLPKALYIISKIANRKVFKEVK